MNRNLDILNDVAPQEELEQPVLAPYIQKFRTLLHLQLNYGTTNRTSYLGQS